MDADRRHRRFAPPAGLVGFVLLALVLPSCGYRLAGEHGTVPGGVRSIHVGEFENHSREHGLDDKLAFALERELYRQGVVRVEEKKGRGDAEIRGAIRKFRTRPVAFDADDEALQYEIEMVVDAILELPDDGEVLWRSAGIYAVDAYSVRTDTVVPTSSRFQRGRIEFDTLDDLTAIQLAETARGLAVGRLVEAIVRDLHDRLLDDF